MKQHEHEEILQSINKYSQVFNAMVQDIFTKQALDDTHISHVTSVLDPNKLISLMSDKVEIDSAKLIQSHISFMEKQSALWQQASMAMMGEAFQPVITEPRSDRRFGHDEWQEKSCF